MFEQMDIAPVAWVKNGPDDPETPLPFKGRHRPDHDLTG
jgi:hypothetical protein